MQGFESWLVLGDRGVGELWWGRAAKAKYK
jgi:hypothetical protein